MRYTKLAAVATVALAASTLAACAPSTAPSWFALGYQSKASVYEGTVTLKTTTIAPTLIGASGETFDRKYGGSNTTARVSTDATYLDGNWKIKGSWSDGFVRFKFSGWALDSWAANNYANNAAPNQALNRADGDRKPRDWVSGGCSSFVTYYTSTNSAYPGTGIAEIVLCDNGPSTGPSSLYGNWPNPDTVAVRVLPTREGGLADASPYVGYSSGGTLPNGKVSVLSAFTGVTPSATAPTIDFLSPTPLPTSS